MLNPKNSVSLHTLLFLKLMLLCYVDTVSFFFLVFSTNSSPFSDHSDQSTTTSSFFSILKNRATILTFSHLSIPAYLFPYSLIVFPLLLMRSYWSLIASISFTILMRSTSAMLLAVFRISLVHIGQRTHECI